MSVHERRDTDRSTPDEPAALTRIEANGFVYYGPAEITESSQGEWIRATPADEVKVGWNA